MLPGVPDARSAPLTFPGHGHPVLTSERLEGLWRFPGHGLDIVRDRRRVPGAHGTIQHTELKRIIGDITQRVLTQTLRSLERDGYVIRTVHPTSPPTVEYRLTKMGESLLKPMTGLVAWASPALIRARVNQPTAYCVGKLPGWICAIVIRGAHFDRLGSPRFAFAATSMAFFIHGASWAASSSTSAGTS